MCIWSTYMHSLKWFKHTPIGRNYLGVPRQKPGKFSRVDIQHKDSIVRGEFLGSESCDDERWFGKKRGKLEIWSVFGIKFWKNWFNVPVVPLFAKIADGLFGIVFCLLVCLFVRLFPKLFWCETLGGVGSEVNRGNPVVKGVCEPKEMKYIPWLYIVLHIVHIEHIHGTNILRYARGLIDD